MLIWINDADVLVTAVEGTGDNLLDEDIKEGYRDYIMTNVYARDGHEIVENDGGQLMLEKMYADMEEDEIIKRVLDFWGYNEFEYVILEN